MLRLIGGVMNQNSFRFGIVAFFFLLLALILVGGLIWIDQTIRQTSDRALQPMEQANQDLRTQVSRILNPTPTILPDPVTILHEVRSLARLETIQYSVEKVITAETNQGPFGFLFGDRLLLVAHGTVIAGIDLEKIGPQDMWMEGQVLRVRLPPTEVFVATLDNDKSTIYNRDTGMLTRGDSQLETRARQAAESEILKSAIADGILRQAQVNAENYLARLLRQLGYPEVMFLTATPVPPAY